MIKLRTATRDDIPVLADVIANVRAQADPSINLDECRAGTTRDLSNWFGTDEPESILSVIEFNRTDVGRFRVVRFPDRIFLGGIQIHPDFQGRGIGTHLVSALIEESRSLGKPLDLNVDQTNIRARVLYERLGFQRQGESEQEIHMRFRPE
ncbi:MAG: GNAT family N-acetyltransferase [Mycobacterium sp.]|nr:GNAT family N-acetyltransferase [Mycobacterium sp.]